MRNIINSLVAYLLYFISPKKLMRRSFIGTLLHFNIRLPDQAVNEILAYLYDIYLKNKKIDRIMNTGGVNKDMECILNLIQSEAFFIRDFISTTHVITSGHEIIVNILEKYNYSNSY